MAASIFQKLLRNQSQSSTTRLIISHLNTTTTTTTTTAIHHAPIFTPPIKTQFLAQPKSQDSNLFNPAHSSQIFPSFSFGYFLNPASSAGFIIPDADSVVSNEGEDSRTIWADSVKKKRKRKMNKHKLKKLRKSLRRKT